ncbi:MAG: energy-coupling factor transporter transmembrane protein EcfT [Clostridia bacterium]|nr:energy-coupling factor transporter transmembrane protein EcfT [Clostridia bacterium]
MRRDAFHTVHPAVDLAFFLFVMLITAFVLHPAVTGISLAAALTYAICLKGRKTLRLCLTFVLPVVVIVAVFNPLFNHAGTTVLFYMKNGNAVTMEAVLYGAVSACMFAALILWCSCLTAVMTSDKYVYLFGRAIPTLSLVFSMVLRFVPRLFARIKLVSEAQKSVAPSFGKSPIKAASHGLSVLSATVTWALESAVTVSDSMHSRGYGLPGRTSFPLFRFDRRDAVLGISMLVCFALSAAAMATGHIRFRFYPSVKYSPADALSLIGYAAFLILCITPLLLNIWERASLARALGSGSFSKKTADGG